MSGDSPTQSGDLGPMPEAEIEPGEPNPGGADSMPDDAMNVSADLPPEDNPAVEEVPEPDLAGAADSDSADDASERAEAEADAPDADPHEDQDEVEGPPGEAGSGEPTA